MKKLILILAVVAFATTAWAQETPKKPSFAGFVSNGFWDNWEMSLGGGVGTALTNGSNSGSFGKRLGFEANFSLVKWVHPVVGMRLQLQGGQFANYDADLGKLKWPYLFVHSDFMLNFSNWAGGYRADRAYYAVPFVGFGYMAMDFTDRAHDLGYGTNQELAFTAGLLNKFRVCPALDIELELKAWMLPSSNMPSILNSGTQKVAAAYSATIGLTYRFNRRGFKQASPYTVEDVMAYQAVIADRDLALAAVQADNAELANDLAAANKAAKKAAAEAAAAKKAAEMAKWGPNPIPADQLDGNAYTDDIYLTGKGITFFNIGQTELSPKEKLRLDIIATQIKNAPKNKIYVIEGHADPQTGSKAVNTRLAEQRAKKVYDYLISKGVKAENLQYKGYSDTKSPFKTEQENRVTVIR